MTQSLENHIKGVHNNQKDFQCEQCPKKCVSLKALKYHTKYVHKTNKETHQCLFCEKSFGHGSILRRHISEVHANEKPFQCDLCTYKTTTKTYLKKHSEAVHQKLKLFQCKVCKKEFGFKSNLQSHAKQVNTKLIVNIVQFNSRHFLMWSWIMLSVGLYCYVLVVLASTTDEKPACLIEKWIQILFPFTNFDQR